MASDKPPGSYPDSEGDGDGVNNAECLDAGQAAAGATPAGGDGSGVEDKVRCGASRGALVDAFLELLAAGDDPSRCNVEDAHGRTALHEAAERGDSVAVGVLLSAGARVDPRCGRRATPLMLAARGGHGDVVRLLLRAGADGLDRRGDDECCQLEWRTTALHHAARGGHVDVVSALLDAGFQRGRHDEAGLSPAEISARAGHASSPAATRLLLGGGGGADGGYDRGGELVHEYVNMVAEDVDIVRGLVAGGPFLDWQDGAGGETALHRAAYFRHSNITEVLLGAGASVNLRNVRGGSPLHVAASTGCAKIVAALLEAGADREARMDSGRSPLHLAVVNDKPDAVLLLLRAGASTESREFERGQTPLSEASEYALPPIISLLLEAGADVESRSTAGLTALHWACRFNSADSVKLLLAAGADPDAVEETATGGAEAAAAGPAGTSQPPRDAVSLKAEDVVGFGDPSRAAEDPRQPFVGELEGAAERRLDPAASSRIARLLQDTRKDRAWRRRGWLVVLAKRRNDHHARAASVRGTFRSVAGVVVENSGDGPGSSQGAQKKVAAPPQGANRTLTIEGIHSKSPKAAGDGSKAPLAAGATTTVGDFPPSSVEGARKNGLPVLAGARVDVGAEEAAWGGGSANRKKGRHGGSSRLSVGAAVEALLELATVEADVFRNVLSYV